ncbi:uncharacterized protein N7479_000335 [Penicillium vulpinum]|uniref:NACHT domain-containing protein n=1 Tax=Penicillium vulpinum TaxID=29845 RepID=A0A1V6RDF8_9EURO|nr:uncharacterized protein N7479_000335 [Penicillium vulpinum]KAJ5970417.1 hypothetical protein N7479_000335 [Penicillium vulpinum]OQD99327.1 hypothetical protein PENVUL_c065G07561 [Penicillium vulpinum]
MPENATEDVGATGGSAAFARALDEYINKPRSTKSKTRQFFQKLQEQQRSGVPIAGAIKNDIIQLERQADDRTAARAARKILGPVVQVLSAYSGIVDVLVSADPMPTAIIWGCLRSAIEGSKRFLELYDKISDQIKKLNTHLVVLSEYEELFDHSSTMRELLQTSYIDIIRFWRRVDKECNRCVANRALRAMAKFSIEKIDGIVTSIANTADSMGRLVPVVQERVDRGERENAAEERRLAGIAREEQKLLLQMYAEEMEKRKEERKMQRQEEVRKWLRDGTLPLNGSNFRHRDNKLERRSPDTCDWLFEHPIMKEWMDSSSPTSQLWVKAAPGAGKSVLTAYAVEKMNEISSNGSAVIYQYFTFDEEFPSLLVYRCLAEQLVNQLGKQTGDIPKDIHKFTQEGATTANVEDIKQFIKLLVDEMTVTYVFLDGLDEECEKDGRKKEIFKVLEFLGELSRTTPNRLRCWYSSQHRTCLDPHLKGLPSIHITKDLNSCDIERYLSQRITDLDSFELDAGYTNLVLRDLREKADGCFLWASLMLESMSDAVTLGMIQQVIKDGLPESYERYYQRKMESIQPALREFVSILLACIVHAKRPLRLDELCECTAMVKGYEGHDIDRSQKIVKKSKILELCQPLVQVHETEGPEGKIAICTLTHGSVKSFLLKNSEILIGNSNPPAYSLTNDVMANICQKYLLQPRYQRLLARKGETFVDCVEDDIMNHHLLSYAAKYWDKHLDDVGYSSEFGEKASRLITSPQFFTLLQIQSLFIDGQFRFWYDGSRPWAGRHIKRVFPYWLESNCDEAFARDYGAFVGEWGPLLDGETSFMGAYQGEIDRCFFGALGSHNYLNKGPSRYKSLMFSADDDSHIETPIRCFEGVDETGKLLTVLKLVKLERERLEFCCEHWCLNGRQSKLQTVETLYASSSMWPLYEYPLAKEVPGRPRLVSFTKDLQFMRIGSQVFIKGGDHKYTQLSILNPEEDYFDEMASDGNFIAVGTRRPLSMGDVKVPEQMVGEEGIIDYAEIVIQELEETVEELDQRTKTGSNSTPNTTQPTSIFTKDHENDSDSGMGTSDTSVLSALVSTLEEPENLNQTTQREKALELATAQSGCTDDLLEESSEYAHNSAYTSWTEGSTDIMSDETEDEEQWNDWDHEKLALEELDIEDRGSFIGSDGNASLLDAGVESVLSDSDDESDGLNDRDDLMPAVSDADNADVESMDSATTYSLSDNEDDSENEDGVQFENLMIGNKTIKAEGTRRTSIRVYDATRKEQIPVFHFTCFIKSSLFDSPPVFHPSKPLLVWPLGDGEVLFANYQYNTYFTRDLCRTGYRSCHIFVKAYFSRDGHHVHFAALEARENVKKNKNDESPSMLLSLQVSTHRLSVRKTTNSPPLLIFRTTLELGSTSKLSVSKLPYFLTWTDKHLFFTTSNDRLDLIRIPLFRPTANTSSPSTASLDVCYLKNPIFLPRSVESRDMYFFPAQKSPQTTSSKKTANKSAMLILGSHCCLPSQGVIVPRHICHLPIAVLLREEDDLVWTCKPSTDETQYTNPASGRLKGKFESFDHEEDCDIVPYLF